MTRAIGAALAASLLAACASTAPPAAAPAAAPAADPATDLAHELVEIGDACAYSSMRHAYLYATSTVAADGGRGRRVIVVGDDGRELEHVDAFAPTDPPNTPLAAPIAAVRAIVVAGAFAPLERMPWPDGAPELELGAFRLRLDADQVVAVRPSGATIPLSPLVPHAPNEIRARALYLGRDAPAMVLEVAYHPATAATGPAEWNAFGLLRAP